MLPQLVHISNFLHSVTKMIENPLFSTLIEALSHFSNEDLTAVLIDCLNDVGKHNTKSARAPEREPEVAVPVKKAKTSENVPVKPVIVPIKAPNPNNEQEEAERAKVAKNVITDLIEQVCTTIENEKTNRNPNFKVHFPSSIDVPQNVMQVGMRPVKEEILSPCGLRKWNHYKEEERRVYQENQKRKAEERISEIQICYDLMDLAHEGEPEKKPSLITPTKSYDVDSLIGKRQENMVQSSSSSSNCTKSVAFCDVQPPPDNNSGNEETGARRNLQQQMERFNRYTAEHQTDLYRIRQNWAANHIFPTPYQTPIKTGTRVLPPSILKNAPRSQNPSNFEVQRKRCASVPHFLLAPPPTPPQLHLEPGNPHLAEYRKNARRKSHREKTPVKRRCQSGVREQPGTEFINTVPRQMVEATNGETIGYRNTVTKIFNCDSCLFSTKVKSKLQHHAKGQHGRGDAVLCQRCGSWFVTEENLRIHLLRVCKGGRNGYKPTVDDDRGSGDDDEEDHMESNEQEAQSSSHNGEIAQRNV